MTFEKNNIEQDLEDILNRVAKTKNIINYQVSVNANVSKGDGFLSEFFTGKVLNRDNGKVIQVAIKRAPAKSFSTNVGNEQLYKSELHFYSKILPELTKFQQEMGVKDQFNNTPTYFAGNTDTNNIYIAMENLKSSGYVLFDKTKYFDKEHLEFIFKVYGKFHALSFNWRKQNSEEYRSLVEPVRDLFAELFTEQFIDYLTNVLSLALKTFDPITEADKLVRLKKVENVPDLMKNTMVYKGNHSCLVHGDCWSNNMFFKYKESGELEDVKLLDFQVIVGTTPIRDLSYFFYSGASKEDMDKLDYYLDIYYESFSNFTKELGGNSEEIFPLEILKKEWKEYSALGVVLGCMLWVTKLMEKDDAIDIVNSDDPGDFMSIQMAKILESGLYKERARNIFLHALEYDIL